MLFQLIMHVRGAKYTNLTTDHDYKYFNIPPMARTLQQIRDLLQDSNNNYGCINDPLLNIELDHVIVDELHLLLRVTDVLKTNLITEAM